MIVKSYEINKINPIDEKFFLFYGKNDGLKNEATIELLRNKEEIFSYDEKEILRSRIYRRRNVKITIEI